MLHNVSLICPKRISHCLLYLHYC